ncbi:transformation/transcription domain-associated protein isoform X2 [Acyrthosiphon pisum]|uniref:Non-specific serine/threonine protein kinase n=1 Tax=Acyrthosiphon pisum TaxID=7029 RepID=A0A8R2JMA0_ACYPI|nr:transformation/transcription domain-associated protein isoform X2 [Acyrthosiphon pisum]
MEPVRKIVHPRTSGPVDLSLILNAAVNMKVKLQLVQKISDSIEECCRTQIYFDNMLFVLLKLLNSTEPVFSPDNDVFKLRKVILQIINKVLPRHEQLKIHLHSIFKSCIQVVETDNEQSVLCSVLILKDLINSFKPKYDCVLKAEVYRLLMLIKDIYNNSSSPEKIFNFQKTSDLKVLITTIRLTTTVTRNSVNYVFVPMGKVSFKVLKELALLLKTYYTFYSEVPAFKKDILELIPVLISFFNLDIPYKPDHRDLVLDLKHAQVRLLFFFSQFVKGIKDGVRVYCPSLPGRIISLMNCNVASDISNIRSELLSGFESVVLNDYKHEFLPYMDKFLDETLITGRSWSSKSSLRPKAYIYIDHLITHLHNQLSLNFLVRVIHLHFSNLLDPTLQPEFQINLCNMVMNVLSYIVQRQNQSITNLNLIEKDKSPLIDLFYRVFQIFVLKLKQFQKFYLPQLNEISISKDNVNETISSILAEKQSKEKGDFKYGYHPSQIASYSLADSKRFIKIIFPAIRTVFQFIVKIEGEKFSIHRHYKKTFNHFLNHSLLSLKICDCLLQKNEMVKEILNALSCISPNHLMTLITGDHLVKQIYANNLETLVFEMALKDEVLVSIFSSLIFDYILNNLFDENEKSRISDLLDKIQLNVKLNHSDDKHDEYVYKIIQVLKNSLQDTKHPEFFIGILKTMLIIVETASYEFGENMYSVIRCLFGDLLSYHKSLTNDLVEIKVALAELCLAECMFKVVLHSHIMDLLSVIAYSLQIPKLTPQGLGILEKCLDILPVQFLDTPILPVRNEIMKGLCDCIQSPYESISMPAVSLLGKFGGLNRSSVMNRDHLKVKEQFHKVNSKKPKIYVTFDDYDNTELEMNVAPGVHTAVQILILDDDRFNRLQSWNVIRGYLVISMEYDSNRVLQLLSNIKLETLIKKFADNELQYTNTITDETYIKALTGLMICCDDEYLKVDALKFFNEFFKRIIYISICHFSDISYGYILEVNPYIITDAICAVLSNEKENIINFGVKATEFILRESRNILGDNVVYFPFITYMFRQFCELCYDLSWIHKRGGCLGLQTLFSNLLKEDTEANDYSNWFIKHFNNTFRATLFIFFDYNRHLTFGTLKIAESNLENMLNWLYWVKPNNPSHDLIQDTILMEITDYITGPNDLLREQSIKIINLMAKQQQKSVSDILEPYYKQIQLAIPGNRLFDTYTFKSQIGMMKGHIFCALHSIPTEQFDILNKINLFYFNIINIVCKGDNKEISSIKMLECLTSTQLFEFRQTAMEVLVHCSSFMENSDNILIFEIFLNALMSSDIKMQEIVYQCLKSRSINLIIELKMVDKLLLYYNDLFQDPEKVTLININYIFYVTKLFPSSPNKMFCTTLLNSFQYLWNNQNRCIHRTSMYELELSLEKILQIVSQITETHFFHIKEICEFILNQNTLNVELCNRLYPYLTECLLKFPVDCVQLFFLEQNIKNSTWTLFFNSMIRNNKCEILRNVMTSDCTHLETLLSASRIDPSRTIQYESIQIIYNLVQTEKKWIFSSKKIISIILNIWTSPQYKERYKNLAAIKSTEWNEPKMLLKIVLAYYRDNNDEVFILFQILPVFSNRFPIDINFFRRFLENEIIQSSSIQWKRMVFFKFIELYQKRTANTDILGKILQYIILPCFSMCYKKGEKQQLLCTLGKIDENIIGVVLNKIFNNIRVVLNGCDFDGIKVFLCQLICLLIDDLLCFNDSIGDLIHNSIISCTWHKCSMDINVKYHCYLILTYLMLSEKPPKKEKIYQTIHYELLKASFSEALPVINYSLNLIVSAICKKNDNVEGLVLCIKKILFNESQNVPILHHICLFVIKYNTLFFPFKEFLINNIIKALFPIAKTNNIPDFKTTAIELACLIISWELTDSPSNSTLTLPLKRSIDDAKSKVENNNSQSQKKKSSQCIENCLNFLAMVGCQTHDDKPESLISKLAIRSRKLFKNILNTEPIDTTQLQLKFGWFEKLCDSFLKKEQLFKQNPKSIHGNSSASLMNLLAAFETISFLLNVLPQHTMIEAIKPVEDHLIKFLQFAFIEGPTLSNPHNHRDIIVTNRHLTVLQVKQVNEGTLKFIADILKTFSSNEGLEKLHLYIQTIISEGLSSNCSNKLEISLTLLRVSLIHFPNYMNNELLNTMGDIMFKFNENNRNPNVKVLCLEILKTHVDTLPRVGKQVFIEKVVIENLDRARDFENNIPFEVQLKCFELVITYIKDISEAAEGVLLNSTLLEYIKTTTDERIMIIILNIITKWIEICRDEAVFFNCQVIKILKSITFINRFPKLTDYCYKLNLEIFRNWYFTECIEYGISCKSSSIRYEFLNFYDTLWRDGGLCIRLYTLMSNELSYNLDAPIAFYVQLLLIKISRNTKLRGDFPLLVIKNSDKIGAISTTSNFPISYQVQNISAFDMCFSLAQLCFYDEDLAKYLWISLLPNVWSLFNDDQRNLLSTRAMNFLAKSKLRNNFMTVFYEAIILCKPHLNFKPYQMVYIGKTYNLWYLVIDQMENISSYYVHDKHDEAVEGLIQIYSLLRDEDVLESLFQNTIKCEDTKKALSLEQQGYIKEASQMYKELLDQEMNGTAIYQNNSYNKDTMFRKIRLTKCLRELNEWSYLTENILEDDNFLLNIENRWKNSIEKSTCDDLRWYLENKQNIWPSKLVWKYHFYLGMLRLKELDQQVMFTVQEHIDLASTEIIDEWKILPKYLCNAHIPLLQATQLIVELREALNIQNSWSHSPENINNIDTLIQIWHNRNPWIGDSLNVWSDLISWRQTYYSFLNQRDLNLKTHFIKSAQDKSKLLFGEIALKHNMTDVSINILNNINLSNITISNWLHKMNLEVKCKQSKVLKFNKKFNDLANLPLNNDFMDDMKPLLLTIIGSLQDYCGNTDVASKYYGMFFTTKESNKSIDIEWQCVIEDNFKLIPLHLHKCSNRQTQLNIFLTTLNCNEILENAWLQWATLIEHNFNQLSIKDLNIALSAIKCYIIASTFTTNIKCNIVIARILWLLTYDDNKYTLLRAFENCNFIFSDIWLPQMLNTFVEKNIKAIDKIISKIGQWYPQQMYLTLNRMYLTEKMNKTMETMSANTPTNDVRKKTYQMLKIDKIKQMMTLMQKCNLGIIQLDYFVDQITSLGESWDEELRRKLYECLYLSYDFGFENKNLNVRVPRKISNFIKTIVISFVAEDVNTIQLQMKKTFFVPDFLSEVYPFFKQKFSSDFSSASVPTIKLMIIQLRKWINYIEDKSKYPARFVHHFRCPTIHQFDWSVIRIPSDHYIDDSSGSVRIHNFSGHVHLIDKNGTVVKQLSIRGTDGHIYTYNVSRGQAIESEDRIFQLFRVANTYLLDFKETAKRYLKFSIPNTFTIAPNLRMVETKKNSIFSLFEIYTEMNKKPDKPEASWIHEDIDFWFSVLNTCIITERTKPLTECLIAAGNKYGSDEVLKNWVSSIYPLQSDYWTFRKTFVEHYSLLCFFEYAFNLIKLKPEMLNIDKSNGVAVALYYTFNMSEVHGNLVQNHIIPFRLTPNLTKFITPYRKYQMINCLTVTGHCLTNSIDDISVVIKLLLKDEFMANYNIKTHKKISRNEVHVLEIVDKNLKYILKNFNKLKNSSIHNPIPDLLYQAFHKELICYESPTWRAWL